MRYQEPTFEVVKLNFEDVIRTSDENSLTNVVGNTTATNIGNKDGADIFDK